MPKICFDLCDLWYMKLWHLDAQRFVFQPRLLRLTRIHAPGAFNYARRCLNPFTLWLKEVGEVELFNITFDPLFPKPLIINN
jgi:hypothetical protein